MRDGKKHMAFSDIIANSAELRENFLHTKICCSTVNMKYNGRVFLAVSAQGTSEVTQNAQFILRGLICFLLMRTCQCPLFDLCRGLASELE